MKLFVWDPRFHGLLSFLVMAETEDEAFSLVDKQMSSDWKDYDEANWPDAYYPVKIIEPGQVFTHQNS